MTLDNRARFRVVGVAIGVVAAVWAAIQGDWTFAIVFAVASVLMALAVLHQIRRPSDS
jgi:membrane protein implicated in regulation of membrane protease activity